VSSLFDLPFEEPPDEPPAEVAAPETPAARRVRTVSELTAELRSLIERTFFEIWVEGEISNCRLWNTGHYYFTLKDSTAQLKAVLFRTAAQRLRFKPQDGMHVIARGRLSLYEPKGEYQLVCEHLEPHGLGALQMAFEQLKARLQAEGLFDVARKRPLPALPRRIGIVTSLDGAAIRDIIKVLRRRYPNAHLVIRPARVQGEGAAADIARGLRAIGRVKGVDVVIVGRGGGSIEDLWAFNEEVVARAIAASPVPVISAVGHEVDVTIADFVADVRAPTPSAAAELVVSRKDEFCGRIDRLSQRLLSAARRGLQRRAALVLPHRLQAVARGMLARRERAFHQLHRRLEAQDQRRRLALVRTRLTGADGRLAAAAARHRHRADGRLRALAGRLENLSPLGVLARGYAVCWSADRTRIIRDAASVVVGDEVHVTLHHGELACDVKATRS